MINQKRFLSTTQTLVAEPEGVDANVVVDVENVAASVAPVRRHARHFGFGVDQFSGVFCLQVKGRVQQVEVKVVIGTAELAWLKIVVNVSF